MPTPVAYFGAFHLRTGCCVSVTGSHNPADYNGFKIVVGGETLSGDAIVDLYARIAEDRLLADTDQGVLLGALVVLVDFMPGAVREKVGVGGPDWFAHSVDLTVQ